MVLFPLLAGCAYEVPLDPDRAEPSNVLQGTVVVTGADELGDVMVLLFPADDPPPPTGTGSPVDFATVAEQDFTGSDAGVQSSTWSITGVPDGDWLVYALMDVDGDFHPLVSSNAGATCGDWMGAHVGDLAVGEPARVSVGGGQLLDDVTVVVGNEMTTERPAFTVLTDVVVQTQASQTFTLTSTAIHSQLLDLTGPFDGTDPCGTAFLFYAPDADGDGAPDPHADPAYAQAGAYDVWPRIYLQYLGDDLEAGESWATEAIVYPAPLLTGEATVGVPTLVTSLTGIFVPAALHTLPDGTEEVVTAPSLPTGGWSVTVVSITGQTWTVPNETAGVPATDASFDPLTQADVLAVQ